MVRAPTPTIPLRIGALVAAFALSLGGFSSSARAEEHIGPFDIAAPDDAGTLGIGFAAQLRAQVAGKAVLDSDYDITPSVNIQRLRFVLRGSFLEDRSLMMGFQINTLPGALEVLDAWMQYRFHEHAQVQTGVFKIPFTVHRAQSFGTLVLTDWGLGTRHFGAERQLGAMIHNFGAGRFRYGFGVFMGENMRKAFANRHTGYYGEPVKSPLDLTQSTKLEDPHPELVAQVGWGSKDAGLQSNSDGAHKGLRYHVSASAAYDAQPTLTRDMQLRLAPEFLLKWEGLSFNAVFYAGFSELSGEGPVEGFAPLMFGPQTEIAYRPVPAFEIAARHAYVHVTDELRDDAKSRAEGIIAAAGEDAVSVVSAQYGRAGTIGELHEVTGGVNIYFVGHSLKLQTEASWFPRLESDLWYHDWQVRSQLQLMF